MNTTDRRNFIKNLGILSAAAGISSLLPLDGFAAEKKEFFQISLAEWSFHKALFAGEMSNLDFPLKAKELDIHIVEYVSTFFNKKGDDPAYLKELKNRTDSEGIQNHLIMVDGEGDLGNLNAKERLTAVHNHHKWIDAAKTLGCKTIRVNASGYGPAEDVKLAAIDGLGKLAEYGQKNKINIIVENHGGYSSDGKWLSAVMKGVNNKYCGTLPDFGNFRINDDREYDKYLGVQEMMPYAKGISAKTFEFTADGNEKDIDYDRMFKIIKAAKWTGIVGIEYEGSTLSEPDGIRKSKALLERVRETYK